MGKDKPEAVKKPELAVNEFGENRGTSTATSRESGLDSGASPVIKKITDGERNQTTNDRAMSSSGFRPADDILAPDSHPGKSDKVPVIANADGSKSLIRADHTVVTSDKANSFGDIPKVQVLQHNATGDVSSVELYKVIKGDLVQSRFERDDNGQWSSVDYKGTRAPARATDLGNGQVSLAPQGARTGAEQINDYTAKLFAQAKRDSSPDPKAEQTRAAELERSIYMQGANQSHRDATTLHQPDGSKYVPGKNGGGVEISNDGQVLQTRSSSDVYTKFGYGADKELKSIDSFEVSKTGTGVTHTQYVKEADGSWASVSSDGVKTPAGKTFKVTPEGTVQVKGENKTTDITLDGRTKLSDLQTPEKIFKPGATFRSSEPKAGSSGESSELINKLAQTPHWQQASAAERTEVEATIKRANLSAPQHEELWKKVGEKATKGVALVTLVSGLLAAVSEAQAKSNGAANRVTFGDH